MARAIAVFLLVAACTSHPPHTDPPPPVSDAAPAKPVALIADDCSKMIDHIFDLALADKHAKDPDAGLEDAKIAAARQKLHDELMPQCVGYDRSSYDCVMAATTSEQVAPCFPG